MRRKTMPFMAGTLGGGKMKSYDAVVIGAGPAGITATLYLCRSGLKVALVEMLAPGGQVLKTKRIENYPGFPNGIQGWELADIFSAHLEHYTFDRYNDAILNVTTGELHTLTVGKESLQTKTLLICSGVNPRRLGLDLKNEKRLVGHGVSYCASCDGNFFRNQTVAVVGGSDSALESALYLANIAQKVYLIHSRKTFRAVQTYQDKIHSEPKIKPILETNVIRLEGERDLQALILQDVNTKVESRLPVEGLFIFIGHTPQNQFFPTNLAVDKRGFIQTDTEMRTNIPGIFAAGDIRSKMCRQIVTAVGDGATAAQAAFQYIQGEVSQRG